MIYVLFKLSMVCYTNDIDVTNVQMRTRLVWRIRALRSSWSAQPASQWHCLWLRAPSSLSYVSCSIHSLSSTPVSRVKVS